MYQDQHLTIALDERQKILNWIQRHDINHVMIAEPEHTNESAQPYNFHITLDFDDFSEDELIQTALDTHLPSMCWLAKPDLVKIFKALIN